jgi:hypothetical protein
MEIHIFNQRASDTMRCRSFISTAGFTAWARAYARHVRSVSKLRLLSASWIRKHGVTKTGQFFAKFPVRERPSRGL